MVNLDTDTKERFDSLQPDGTTQSEFVAVLLDHYEHTDAEGKPDVAAVLDRLDELEKNVPAKVEIGAYRGTMEAINNE